ncbi:hypothetical protein L1280_002680 [Deinococcus sp. HSC-46F16]|uniref:hypothetical protein n=1 Tax=Deinococcus sp. HSC-46F16 TaxID=2910968 RepID=UPI00209DC526|nr:hypothetical protein [Deinococcus sp. HSC-46F16]MCP2015518.1 hypothetical protein [Deinococcus sp. HSC-46F16]
MPPADDPFFPWLAEQARRLGLETALTDGADPEALCTLALLTLQELAARGYLPAEPEVGCWGRPRSRAN